MVFCVGLTGGIGCGKSLAASLLQELGADVVDTDDISRELTGPGGAAIDAIRLRFGDAYIAADGSLDRPRMRREVFSNPEAKRKLEEILHPLIRAGSRTRIAASTAPYVVLVVPLLLETGGYRDLLKRIVVVDCDEAQQVSRTMQRSGLAAEEVHAIMASQMRRSDRVSAADEVIVNDGDINQLRNRVTALHQRLIEAATRA